MARSFARSDEDRGRVRARQKAQIEREIGAAGDLTVNVAEEKGEREREM